MPQISVGNVSASIEQVSMLIAAHEACLHLASKLRFRAEIWLVRA
jgi:hypothetical protein